MSTLKTFIKKYGTILFALALFLLLVYQMVTLKEDIANTSEVESQAYSDEPRFAGEQDPLTLENDIAVSSGAGGSGTLWMGTVWEDLGENGQFYCVEPGTLITKAEADGEEITFTNDRTYEELKEICDNTPPTETVTGCSPTAPDVETYHETSTTYFRCKGEHYTEDDSYTDRNGVTHDNLYDIAFLLSW